jgi:superfamily II DNA or RNA helicase
MSVRDERQEQFVKIYESAIDKIAILHLCPRFGKTRVGTRILQHLAPKAKVLISYPSVIIKEAWKEEFSKLGYKNTNVVFTTHKSLHKYSGHTYDQVIIDEVHLLSENQRKEAEKLIKCNSRILGLSGTISRFTEKDLNLMGMKVIAKYPIAKAIEEGVVTDYQITVKLVKLDNKVYNKYKTSSRTEKGQFDAISHMINKLEAEGKKTFFLRLARMRVVQNSISKVEATKALLKSFSTERILTFCGLINIANKLGVPVYSSRHSDKSFKDFLSGKINSLAVVKMGNTGQTYAPLSKVIINYFDSNSENLAQKINRCMGLEYSNPGKKADIWIVSSDEPVELNWLKKALEFLDVNKIKYI